MEYSGHLLLLLLLLLLFSFAVRTADSTAAAADDHWEEVPLFALNTKQYQNMGRNAVQLYSVANAGKLGGNELRFCRTLQVELQRYPSTRIALTLMAVEKTCSTSACAGFLLNAFRAVVVPLNHRYTVQSFILLEDYTPRYDVQCV
ncbi:hypothetical protein AXF42_Ash008170 [Apostasia shenzhenica]|uniref:Cystatin domain-containing protein n=1 Tax=Apostasia shenzhenica TaxID=1088818 RepID=A0A2I0A8R3_9ASPA|nr:hypothetical protein AXF42_Ash008169 [Apostasia shenzhenica]PKA51941.1 hypothetical protein AXF42_Ash008170 [Apostasia shenzhenica]